MGNPAPPPGWLPPVFKHSAAEIGEGKDYRSFELLYIGHHRSLPCFSFEEVFPDNINVTSNSGLGNLTGVVNLPWAATSLGKQARDGHAEQI